MTRRDDGQILVLFSLLLVLLMGVAALVVDIGLKYSLERRYQSIADGASLAGAQELQPTARSQPVTTAMQNRARTASLAAIANELVPGTTPSCVDWTDCDLDGGRYNVSIITPSPTCVDCEPNRSVQVTVTEPEHPTGFARLFGQTTWSVGRTSVAGLSFGKSYTIVALRPPKPLSGSSTEVRDIRLDGGVQVNVFHGDVGTNANMDYASCSSLMHLEDGYRMYYYDTAPEWCANPVGTHIGNLIEDPGYTVPAAPAVVSPATPKVASTDPTCGAALTAILTDARYATYVPLVPKVPSSGAPDPSKVKCYRPGTYTGLVKDGNGELTILYSGLYYFNGGLDIQSSIIGGYNPDEMGVTLRFPRDKQFKQRNGAVALNAGTKFKNASGVEPSTAPAMTNTTPNIKITLYVQPDPACPVVLPYPTGCHDNGTNKNAALDLAGGAGIYLGGVQYAPSDNSVITGNGSSAGYIGQIWAWTLTYNGNNTVINQEGFGPDGPGRIRIDTACSPTAVCN